MAVPPQLLQQLLALDESVRLEIAHALLASVDPSDDDGMSDAEREKLHASIERSIAHMLILPAASEPLVGTPVEAFDLARDEVSNVWAIERTRLGADDRPREVRPVSPPTPSRGEPAPRYRVGPDVPTGYHPYVTREGSEGLEVARARIPGTTVADEPTSLPARLVIAAVPRTARQLQQIDELTRATDGSYHLIRRRALVPVAPRQGVTLQFDQLVGGKAPE